MTRSAGKGSFQDMQLIQKLRDDKKCMKKVEPSSRSKAIEDIISIRSFVKALVLNHYTATRFSIFGKHVAKKIVVPVNGGLTEFSRGGLFKPLYSGLLTPPRNDNMANENAPAPAPIRSDDQILQFAAWDTFLFEAKTEAYRFQLDEDWFRLDANLLREALEITPVNQAHQFVPPPSGDAIMDFVNQLGNPEEIHYVSRMALVSALVAPTNFIKGLPGNKPG
nr:hypothetical protein [Tanacetum cinerariifolium]